MELDSSRQIDGILLKILGYRQNIVPRQYINVITNTVILNYLYKICIKIQDYTCWIKKRNLYFTYGPLLDKGVTFLSDKKMQKRWKYLSHDSGLQ